MYISKMTLTFADKKQLSRQKEIAAYRDSILESLKQSKKLALECDNLVKLRAMKMRCDKISQPRFGLGCSEQQEKYHREERYQTLRLEQRAAINLKWKKIREIGVTS